MCKKDIRISDKGKVKDYYPKTYIFNTSEQNIPDLEYVSFNCHEDIREGVLHDSNPPSNKEIKIIEPGDYHVTYSVFTKEIAYFFLEWRGKHLSVSSFFKGRNKDSQQDVGHVILNASSVPGVLKLQNISGYPVNPAPMPKNAWILIRKIC
jgi:hypothetical protein